MTRPKLRAPIGLLFLVAPLLLFVIPAALGHPPIFGDNATQNEPLRWLAGTDLRHGILPAWDPFNWSGTPLLAGFNAGTFYPLIAWFVLLPPAFATAMALASAWYVAEFAVYGIARRYGIIAPIAAAAAVVFVLSGSFLGQVVHLDMIEGDAAGLVSVWALLALLESRDSRDRLLHAALLAAAFAAVVLAGAPEAMLAFLVALSTITAVRIARREAPISILLWIAPAAALALGLSAPQWVPGLAYVAISTRNHLPANYAGSGPYSWIFLPLAIFPFAYGGYQGDYLPSFFGNYNPSEINITLTTVGIVFLLIAITTRRLPGFRRRTELLILFAVGAVFALGSHTPLAPLIYRLPLFSLQRLASRYLIDINLAAIVLAAAGLQHWWSRGCHLDRMATAALWIFFALSAVFAAFAALLTGPTLTLFQTNSVPTGSQATALRVYLALQLLLLLAAVWIATGRKIGRVKPAVVLSAILLVDTLNLASQFVWAPSYHNPAPLAQAPPASKLISGPFQRLGVYDPSLFVYYRTIPANEQPDRNAFTQTGSIQGYASLSLAGYNRLTGTKVQSTLQPDLIPLYQRLLNLDLLITAPRYFVTDLGSRLPSAAPNLPASDYPAAGSRGVAEAFTGNVAAVGAVDYLAPRGSPPARVTLTSSGGATSLLLAPQDPVAVDLAGLTAFSIHSRTPRIAVRSAGNWYLLAGPLSRFLSPRSWTQLTGEYGTIDYLAKTQRKSLIPSDSAVTIVSQSQGLSGTVHLVETATRPTRATTILAWAPGWQATPGVQLLDQHGLLALSLKKGLARITLSYHAPSTSTGFLAGGLSAGILLACLLLYWYLGLRSHRHRTKVP